MIILPDHKAVFVSCPKTGSHTFYSMLIKEFGGYHTGGPEQHPYHPRDIPAECKDWFKFTSTRNPYERAVSIWWSFLHAHKDKEKTATRIGSDAFPAFIEWLTKEGGGYAELSYGSFLPQMDWHRRNWPFDAVVRLEHLADDLPKLPFWKQGVEVPHLLKRQHKYGKWREQYDTDTIIAASDFYAEDFAYLDYTWAGSFREVDCD